MHVCMWLIQAGESLRVYVINYAIELNSDQYPGLGLF